MQHRAPDLPPFVATPIPDAMKSKRYQPADLPVGTSVFYRGERYYITRCPPDWGYSAHVRICDKQARTDLPREPDGSCAFGVHPDLLDLAPKGKTPYAKQPTQRAVIAKADREAKGINDAGDVVAELLRGLDLDAVYAVASEFLGEDEQGLRDKYGHLNNGQQRMNCGNRMRNWLKKNGGAK